MRRLGAFWLCHCLATVAGWYLLSALAQGAVDTATSTPFPLVIFNAIMQILCFPLVLVVLSFATDLGSYSPGSFLAFVAVAAVNSAVVTAIVAAALRAFVVHKSAPGQTHSNKPDSR
jgi:ABC-type amino acid transport system permease subunit